MMRVESFEVTPWSVQCDRFMAGQQLVEIETIDSVADFDCVDGADTSSLTRNSLTGDSVVLVLLGARTDRPTMRRFRQRPRSARRTNAGLPMRLYDDDALRRAASKAGYKLESLISAASKHFQDDNIRRKDTPLTRNERDFLIHGELDD